MCTAEPFASGTGSPEMQKSVASSWGWPTYPCLRKVVWAVFERVGDDAHWEPARLARWRPHACITEHSVNSEETMVQLQNLSRMWIFCLGPLGLAIKLARLYTLLDAHVSDNLLRHSLFQRRDLLASPSFSL